MDRNSTVHALVCRPVVEHTDSDPRYWIYWIIVAAVQGNGASSQFAMGL